VAGLRDDEERALKGLVEEDLPHASPGLSAALSKQCLGEAKTRLNAADRHRIAAQLARQQEAEERG
jgi:hypothetical protein